jgi:lipid-binding SYLF domain-containing protein
MKKSIVTTSLVVVCLAISSTGWARNSYEAAIAAFRQAGASAAFFDRSYAYAVFPTVATGAFVVGGAYGKGRVYAHGRHIGDTTVGQVSVGFQAGGKGYSQIIFFEDKRALEEFQSGKFEFGADASVTAITAGANADLTTTGTEAGASAGPHDARNTGAYYKGMAVFTLVKGGLMYSASVAGQKFSYRPVNPRPSP